VLSPDGSALAVELISETGDAGIWVGHVGGASLTPLASAPGRHFYPLWTADGRRVVFGSQRGDTFSISARTVDGRSIEQPLIDAADSVRVPSLLTPGGSIGYSVPRSRTEGEFREVTLSGADRGLDAV
jgi:Tol biopolymer transport system component